MPLSMDDDELLLSEHLGTGWHGSEVAFVLRAELDWVRISALRLDIYGVRELPGKCLCLPSGV